MHLSPSRPGGSALLLCAALVLSLGGCPSKKPVVEETDGPPDPAKYLERGLQILDADPKKLAEAHAAFQEGCDLHKREDFQIPIHPKVCYDAGLTAARMGDLRKAIAYYGIALKGDPSFKPAVNNITIALLDSGKAVDALPHFEGYLKAHGDDADMVNNYSAALGAAGRYDDGVRVVQELLFKDPKNTRAYKTLARIYFLQGNYRMSQLASANALKFTPDDADIHNNIGLTFLKDGKEADAAAAFRAALDLDADNAQANMNLGLLALRAADWQKAGECFNRVLAKDPGNADARVGLAVAYRGNASFDEAIAEYDTILKGDSCNRLALLNRAVVQGLFLDDHKAALKTYEAHKKCHPDIDIGARVAVMEKAIAEAEELKRQQEELERQLAELERKAAEMGPKLKASGERAARAFEKYKDVEQDPSWKEQLALQLESLQYAVESGDFYFMEEASGYLDEFMASYYEYALGKPADEWNDKANPIDVAMPPAADGGGAAPSPGETPAPAAEAAPAAGDAAGGAPASGEGGSSTGDGGASGDAPPPQTEPAPAP